MTVEYLRDKKGVHNLLYAILPREFADEAEYLDRYTGDEYVDIFGFDYYKLWDARYIPELGQRLGQLHTMANILGKLAALTEVGLDNLIHGGRIFYSRRLNILRNLKKSPGCMSGATGMEITTLHLIPGIAAPPIFRLLNIGFCHKFDFVN